MIFVKTFKGYEDKTHDLDQSVNTWIGDNNVEVQDIKTVLGHEPGGRSQMGDMLYTVLYKADRPVR